MDTIANSFLLVLFVINDFGNVNTIPLYWGAPFYSNYVFIIYVMNTWGGYADNSNLASGTYFGKQVNPLAKIFSFSLLFLLLPYPLL